MCLKHDQVHIASFHAHVYRADPYCAMMFSDYDQKQIKQTPFLCRTLCPNWGSYFSVDVHSVEELSKDLQFHVYDRNQYGDDDLMGSARLSPEYSECHAHDSIPVFSHHFDVFCSLAVEQQRRWCARSNRTETGKPR
eukprot:SAG11_NODE_627_length_8087_cov_3.567852_6_plen_137_part_00